MQLLTLTAVYAAFFTFQVFAQGTSTIVPPELPAATYIPPAPLKAVQCFHNEALGPVSDVQALYAPHELWHYRRAEDRWLYSSEALYALARHMCTTSPACYLPQQFNTHRNIFHAGPRPTTNRPDDCEISFQVPAHSQRERSWVFFAYRDRPVLKDSFWDQSLCFDAMTSILHTCMADERAISWGEWRGARGQYFQIGRRFHYNAGLKLPPPRPVISEDEVPAAAATTAA